MNGKKKILYNYEVRKKFWLWEIDFFFVFCLTMFFFNNILANEFEIEDNHDIYVLVILQVI
jgi:hypothetical protein